MNRIIITSIDSSWIENDDYINRIGYDNREINLRETTLRENVLNCRLRKDNFILFFFKQRQGEAMFLSLLII